MTISKEIRVGDKVPVELTVYKDDGSVLNISSATVKEIIFRKPDGTKLTETGSFVTDGSDGKLMYTLLEAENNMAGIWKVQAHVDLPVIGSKSSTIPPFEVHPNL